MLKEYALIVAGGTGTRLKSNIPKQFLELEGTPILMRTVMAFYNYSPEIFIIVVLPENQIDYWKILCRKYAFDLPHQIIAGGSTRQQSVLNGLKAIKKEGIVAIHDGVRPLVKNDIISRSFTIASQHGNAVAAVSLKDSIRILENGEYKAVDRNKFKLIQTPQTFLTSVIKNAYDKFFDEEFTDDAGIAERAGERINLIEGSYDNIKITTSEDIFIAKVILRKLNEENPRK
jgi:2-C-methyl-D-erythritol 4-phosphate cytidylyltransferase